MLVKSVAVLAATASTAAFAQQIINWNTAGAIVGGSKVTDGVNEQICFKDSSTFLVEAGNQLSVILTDLGVALPSGSSSRTGRATCDVAVPVTVRKGQYLADLTQTMTYGIVKTSNTSAAVSGRTRFFGYPLPTFGASYGSGSQNIPFASTGRTDTFLVNTPIWSTWFGIWCSGANPSGLYQAKLAVSGLKNGINEDLTAGIDGLDVKFQIRPGSFTVCPALP
jgi:hypothetical protein